VRDQQAAAPTDVRLGALIPTWGRPPPGHRRTATAAAPCNIRRGPDPTAELHVRRLCPPRSSGSCRKVSADISRLLRPAPPRRARADRPLPERRSSPPGEDSPGSPSRRLRAQTLAFRPGGLKFEGCGRMEDAGLRPPLHGRLFSLPRVAASGNCGLETLWGGSGFYRFRTLPPAKAAESRS
jgi:hypothetical protein